ncbi:MAG: nucleotidyltransferase domain-containing protein [Spirochaetota bacterium]
MRLKETEVRAIKESFEAIFQEGDVYLFGSRTDDAKKGGDIDLFMEIQDRSDLFPKKIRFLAMLKRRIGDQRIDVVFNEDASRLIEQEARRWAIRL